MHRLTASMTCNVTYHRRELVAVLESIKIEYCSACDRLGLRRTWKDAPLVRSIIQVAEVAKDIVPKVENGSIPKPQFKERVVEEAVRRYGMNPKTVDRAIRWLVEAGKSFAVAVNGVLHLMELGVYDMLVRLQDMYGDPPICSSIFTCPNCRTNRNTDDVIEEEVFQCVHCGHFFRYGEVIQPILKIKLSETWDLKGNYLVITLRNMQGRVTRYSLNLLKNGTHIGVFEDKDLELAPDEEMVGKLSHDELEQGDRLQVEIRDLDTNECYGRSNEIVWSNHPWAPVAIGIGGAIAVGLTVLGAALARK